MGAPRLFVGLISGTSMDGIDAVLADCGSPVPRLLASCDYPIPGVLKQQLLELCTPGDNEIERAGSLDRQLGELFAAATRQLLEQNGTPASEIVAIGSHGQTIRHRPPLAGGAPAFSLQLGDPATIAEHTGICVIADFRHRDIAAGGHGAPLAPAFHRAALAAPGRCRAVINIGGMSNLTVLDGDTATAGFDCGPGNVLMDLWIQRHQGAACDRNGAWAAGGRVDETLLARMLDEPYFSLPAPRSTGRELFNAQWLERQLTDTAAMPTRDVQATLLELSARSIAQCVQQCAAKAEAAFVCGGGAHNGALMERLAQLLQPIQVESTASLGIAPDWVEALAFAWLASRCLNGLPGNMPAVTGAAGERILGAIHPA